MLPSLESLRCFDAAATSLNFRAAASAVALSPPAFSGRIRQLEDLVGGPLFRRSTRRVALTPMGEVLLPRARALLADARAFALVAPGARPAVEFSVGTRFELGLSWLTPQLETLKRSRPERTLHLVFGDSAELLSSISRGTLDAAVTSVRLSGGSFAYETLHEETYAFVASPKLLRAKPLRSERDASSHVLLDALRELPLFRYFLDARPAGEAWAFRSHELLGAISAVRYRALQGAGVAVLPRYFIADDLKRGRLRVLFPGTPLGVDAFRLVWRAGHPREPQLRELAAELRAAPLR